MGNTKKHLPEDIVQELYFSKKDYSEEQIEKAKEIVEKAKQGHYHDFDSPLATPKMQLHMDLLSAGLGDIDKKMQSGDYDDERATKQQSDELMNLLEKDVKQGK